MFQKIQKFFILFFCVMAVMSCSKDSLEENVEIKDPLSQDAESFSYTQMELEVLNKVNEYRQEMGLNELIPLPEASREASNHTDYMIEVRKVSHDNFPVRFNNLVIKAGAIAVSENVAFGYKTADGVFNAWVNSGSHKENIVGDYTHFGISVKEDAEGKNYFTNIFVKK